MNEPLSESDRAGTVIERGATVVITHHVDPQCHAAYERWLEDIAPLARAAPGLLDWQIVRPIAGLTAGYTVILRFAAEAQLHAWMRSPERAGLIERVRPLLLHDDRYTISSGLDFLFAAPAPGPAPAPRVPVRWKQWLITWSAIYPLVYLTSRLVLPLLSRLDLRYPHAIGTLLVTGIVVSLMVYVVMPRYTRAVQGWLYR